MAKQGEGKAEFIKSGESMDDKVMKQLTRALKPALVDVRVFKEFSLIFFQLKVEWPSKVEQTPYHLPPLFAGGRLVVYGFFSKGTSLPSEIVLNANSAVGPQKFTATIDSAIHSVKGSLLCKLAAKSMIRVTQKN
jgi:hypothetical protein